MCFTERHLLLSFSRPQADYVCCEDGTVRDDVLVVPYEKESSGHPILEASLSLVRLSSDALKLECPMRRLNARPRVAPVTVSPNTANALRQVYATDVVFWEAAKGATVAADGTLSVLCGSKIAAFYGARVTSLAHDVAGAKAARDVQKSRPKGRQSGNYTGRHPPWFEPHMSGQYGKGRLFPSLKNATVVADDV